MTNEEIQFEDILIIGDSMDIDFKKSQKKMEQMLILQKKEILEKILDDLWEKAQTDERGFGKAYSYLAGEYLKKLLT